MQSINDVRAHFRGALSTGDFTESRDGSKTIELLGASFVADEPAIFGKPALGYIKRELEWYDSQELNINSLAPEGGQPPAAWQATANNNGDINSNYGYLVFNEGNGSQFDNVVKELVERPLSRRASMVYQRPTIWTDHCEDGKNDFICTNAVTYYVRDNKLHCVVQMRSNDVIFGYRNDYAWQIHLLERLCETLNTTANTDYTLGNIHWQVQNLHVYERHFDLVI